MFQDCARIGIVAAGTALVFGGASLRATPVRSDLDVRVVVAGLNDPRGLTFGPGGDLYIAEAGSGGSTLSTAGLCDQLQPPVGPILGGASARVLKLSTDATVTTVAGNLPSAEASPLIGGDKQGVADVAVLGNGLFALLAGAGCSHGHAEANNGLLRIDGNGSSLVADLSAWLLANPGAKGAQQPRNPDYEPDGTWFSMLVQEDAIYAVEPNHGLLVAIDKHDYSISLVHDLFATLGDHTYTSLASDRDDLYVGTLGQIAFGPGGIDLEHSFEAAVYRIPKHGAPEQIFSGLHAVVGLAFDRRHRMYVLQSPIFVPGTGSLVRIDENGQAETVLDHLVFPSSLRRGPDHALYFSECGFHCQPGDGRVVRVAVD